MKIKNIASAFFALGMIGTASAAYAQMAVYDDGTVRVPAENGVLAAAVYDGSGALGSFETAEIDNGWAKLDKYETGMKLMVWDSLEGMRPIIDSETADRIRQASEKVTVTVGGGETEVSETQGEKTLEPFTASAVRADGSVVENVSWQWSAEPAIMAAVTDGVVTINAHATAGSEITVTASAVIDGVEVSGSAVFTVVEAPDTLYTFDGFSVVKPFDRNDVSDAPIGDTGITADVSAGGKYAGISVQEADMSAGEKTQAGFYPYGDAFKPDSPYLFLAAGGDGSSPSFMLTLPETATSDKYINIRYAKVTSTNNGTSNRTEQAPDSAKKISAGEVVIDAQTDHDYDTWYTASLKPAGGVDTIYIDLGEWSGLAIDHISVTKEPESETVLEPEDDGKVKLLCIGDSITEGFTVHGGYRNTLCSLIEQNGLSGSVDFIGNQNSGTGYDGDHGGRSGFAIMDIPKEEDCEGKGRNGIYETVDACVGSAMVDVALLQAGTNDVLSLYRLGEAGDRLEQLVLKLESKLADGGVIYLATIPYISESAKYNNTGKTQAELDEIIDTFNASVRDIADKYDDVELADINSVLEFSDLQDGIHPNAGGYEKMGNYWYSLIAGTLSEKAAEKAGE